MQHGVFISYRRSDTAGHAGRISGDLERHFGHAVVFRDVDSIAVGEDFVSALEAAVGHARAVIVLIGDTWLASTADDATRRLDDPQDHVRREVEMALAHDGLRVVPVLVEGARMPVADELPETLRPLARLQAIALSEDRWRYDIGRLAEVLEDAGVRHGTHWRRKPLLAAAALFAVLAVGGLVLWSWSGPAVERYIGVWHLPNGSFWTVREADGRLWVEETHYDSRQVWKRGPAQVDDDGLSAVLSLVFEDRPFRYLHRLQLSRDGETLLGSVRRSDRDAESTLVLTRTPQ